MNCSNQSKRAWRVLGGSRGPRPLSTAAIAVASVALFVVCGPLLSRSEIRNDETVILFPTYAFRGPGASWTARIHAWVFELERRSLKRRAAISFLRSRLGISSRTMASVMFKERAQYFLVDNQRGKRLRLQVDGASFELPATAPGGHVQTTVSRRRVPLSDGANPLPRSVPLVVAGSGGARFLGRLSLLEARGLAVISDIDDTIKDSNVRNHKELIANTFERPFRAVPGMAEVYRRWALEGASFHYVSGSPWQLYPSLAEFFRTTHLPIHSIHLRNLRAKDRSIIQFLNGDQIAYKIGHIETITRDLSERSLILVGDSGEKDPEIYEAVRKRLGSRVLGIFIRDVSGEGRSAPRFRALARAASNDGLCFLVFKTGADLSAVSFLREGDSLRLRGCPEK